MLYTPEKSLHLQNDDRHRRRHRPDVYRIGNAGRAARHLAVAAPLRRRHVDLRLPRRHVLQHGRDGHREFDDRRKGPQQPRGRSQGAARVLLLPADELLRRRALLHGRRLRPRSARPRGQTAAHVGRGDAHRADRGPRIVSGRTAPHPHERGCGQPRRSRHGPHAHRQTRHVEQGLRQGARSHRRAGTDLRRRPLGLPGFGHSVPDEEHARIDLRSAAHLYRRRTDLHLQRRQHLHALSAQQRQRLLERGDRGAGRRRLRRRQGGRPGGF